MTNKSKWLVVTAAMLTMFLLNVDWLGVNVALPPIAKNFHATLEDLQWVANGYIMSSMMFMVLGGRLSNLFGRRHFFVLGALIFLAGSLLAGLAPGIWVLVVARMIQGIGFSFVAPMLIAMVLPLFPENRRGFAASLLTIAIGAGQAAGPSLAGIIIHLASWRWLFLINFPMGLITIYLILKHYHHSSDITTNDKIDYIGAAILAVALLLVSYALNQTEQWHVTSFRWEAFICFGIVLLCFFFYLQTKVKQPLIDLSLFRNKGYVLAMLARCFFQYPFISFIFIIVLYFQNILGKSALDTGYLLLFFTVPIGVFAPFAGRLLDRVGIKPLFFVAMILLVLSYVVFAASKPSTPFALTAVALLLMGAATAVSFSCVTTTLLSYVSQKQASLASALYYTIVMVISVLSMAFSTYWLSLHSYDSLTHFMQANHLQVAADKLYWLKKVADGSQSASVLTQHFTSGVTHQLTIMAHRAFMSSFKCLIASFAVFAALAGIIILFLPKRARAVK